MTFVPQSFPYIADSIKFLISESIQDIFCNYAYEPYYNQKDAEEFYYQMKEVSDYLFDNNLKDIYISCLDMLAWVVRVLMPVRDVLIANVVIIQGDYYVSRWICRAQRISSKSKRCYF